MTRRKTGETQGTFRFGPTLPLCPLTRESDKGTAWTIATWNVNSIQARIDLVLEWLKRTRVDVLCMQETRVADEHFPEQMFISSGYHVACHGEAGRNGVAIVSRSPLHDVTLGAVRPDAGARLIGLSVGPIRVINVYAPNAQAVNHASFERKICWLRELSEVVYQVVKGFEYVILCGDFNVAPEDSDAHKSLGGLIETFVHPEVRAALSAAIDGRLCELRPSRTASQSQFTWWDYRMNACGRDVGMRLDHMYVDRQLAQRCTAISIDRDARRMHRPSDHAPVLATFDLKDVLPCD